MNLNDYLEILYRNEWERSFTEKQDNDENDQKKQQSFKNLKEKYAHYFSTERDDIFRTDDLNDLSLHLLNSKTFQSFFKNEQIVTDIVYCILSAILKMICIQHNRNDMMKTLKKNDTFKMIQISNMISHYSIAIMKMWMITKKQTAHD